ncbi:alpha-hydroxy acid oxidase [Rhizobium hidalgonense]|uniref:Alpha-hydroxy acid oxidase n=1 Tax=Rhizobium hidalgonense TaxID=1538159 RepID=A0A2A6KKF4_9HYPH|nr:alpha-hydroxy acid oxidase [Rhizobium hidalgonense]MDR9772051.1 alpha-hydroxy acid oxidase [Rhizobium hidalgonense]MDR9810109.1 alpha-hydroxy acid oxidase [Rhizobium hidalgonense]MDR9817863.1 alpha-hydroxy acid oxidase [Rhizobium hidalgonense]PDT25018.1 alpha-hydroxy-acid oxidizing enzyme [Rhizobium hidalgonense]PON06175.1 alpha-hydroxy-acid oxidizing enzyme [Rhizobium hidalgonense]
MKVSSVDSRRLTRLAQAMLCLDDFEPKAKRHLPKPLYGYIAGGSETNASLRKNVEAFQTYALRPRILQDVSTRSTETTLFGRTYAAPFGIAPMGISALMAYRGDIVLAAGAAQCGIPMIMSGSSLIRLEEVIAAAPATWFQAYLPGEPERIDALVDRVAAAGFTTLLLTVDTAVLSNRENNIRAGFSTPLRPSLALAWQGVTHPQWTIGTFLRTIARHGIPHFENSYATRGAPIIASNVMRDFGRRDHLNWSHLERIRNRWSGKLIVKGILHPDDAARAAETGADGVIVSNHGGRQLDGAITPLMALPEIVERLGDRIPIMIDGGFRRGTDVIKALALGARFVFVGRPFLYAAAVAGLPGVLRAAGILKAEIHSNMALLGVTTIEQVSSGHLVRT